MQHLAMFTKKEKKILEVRHKRNIFFREVRKIVGTYMGKSTYAPVARRENTTNQDNKYRILVVKLIQSEAIDWQKFQEQLKKKYTRTNFIKHQLSSKVEMGEIQCCSPNKNPRRIYPFHTNYYA